MQNKYHIIYIICVSLSSSAVKCNWVIITRTLMLLQTFIESASNLLDTTNTERWKSVKESVNCFRVFFNCEKMCLYVSISNTILSSKLISVFAFFSRKNICFEQQLTMLKFTAAHLLVYSIITLYILFQRIIKVQKRCSPPSTL